MNVINFEDGQCKRIRSYLDSYLDSELMVETNHEVLRHLDICKLCARLLEDRARLKARLKHAVTQENAPAALRERIGGSLRQSRRFTFSRFSLAVAAAAAVLVVTLGTFFNLNSSKRPQSLQSRPLSLQAEVAPGDVTGRLLKIGFEDHVSCAIDHGMANKQFTSEQMSERLGPEYAGLVELVRTEMPADSTVVVGHRCHYQNREFVHLIVRTQNDVVSLVITRKNGEAFPANGAAAILPASGVPIHEAAWRQIQVAGMETRDYLAFIISNKTVEGNEQIATRLAPPVSDFLKKLET